MRRTISILLCFVFLLSMVSCGPKKETEDLKKRGGVPLNPQGIDLKKTQEKG